MCSLHAINTYRTFMLHVDYTRDIIPFFSQSKKIQFVKLDFNIGNC